MKIGTPNNFCIPMLFAALFTRARYEKILTINRQINQDILYVYNGLLYSHRKNEILTLSMSWMELESIMLST